MNGRDDKMGTVQGLWRCASKYKEHNPGFVLASFCIVYITLQAFAIPGPIVLSILSGAIYPFMEAQLLVAFCATTGASLCFLMSYCLGRGLFNRMFASMIGQFKQKVRGVLGRMILLQLLSVDCPRRRVHRSPRTRATCSTICSSCASHRCCRTGSSTLPARLWTSRSSILASPRLSV